jgi:hypothetical protein
MLHTPRDEFSSLQLTPAELRLLETFSSSTSTDGPDAPYFYGLGFARVFRS